MRMMSRLPWAILTSALLTVTLLGPANAADPEFCRQYARAALVQVRGGLSNSACGGGLQGARWSSDFAVHYEWCLGASLADTGSERDARAKFLKACTGR